MNEKFQHIKELILKNPIFQATASNHDDIKSIGDKIENLLTDSNLREKLQKRILVASIELLITIYRIDKQETLINFILSKESETYFVLFVKDILKSEVLKIVRIVNEHSIKYTKEELKQLYKEMLKNPSGLGHCGSGLSSIDFLRKTVKELLFDFEEIDEETVRLTLIAEIKSDS